RRPTGPNASGWRDSWRTCRPPTATGCWAATRRGCSASRGEAPSAEEAGEQAGVLLHGEAAQALDLLGRLRREVAGVLAPEAAGGRHPAVHEGLVHGHPGEGVDGGPPEGHDPRPFLLAEGAHEVEPPRGGGRPDRAALEATGQEVDFGLGDAEREDARHLGLDLGLTAFARRSQGIDPALDQRTGTDEVGEELRHDVSFRGVLAWFRPPVR